MKYFPLIWAGLWRRPVRTILTVLSIITAFFLFGMLEGINVGINSAMDQLKMHRLRVTSRVSMNDPMPVAHLARIATLPGVKRVAPVTVLIGLYQNNKSPSILLGTDIEAITGIYPELIVPRDALEKMKRTPIGAMVGKVMADQRGWKVGDRIPIRPLNMQRADGAPMWEFEIVGIYTQTQPEWATQIWVNADYLENGRVAQGKGMTQQILVEIDDAEKSTQMSEQIDALFANSPYQTSTQNEKDFLQGILAQIGDIGYVVNGIVGAVLFALLFLTANTMMQSVRERIPELAVLKTLGFTDSGVLVLVLTEALLMSILAAFIGLVGARYTLPLLVQNLPNLNGVHMPLNVFAIGGVFALLLALASGLPPAWRAKRLSIVAALRG